MTEKQIYNLTAHFKCAITLDKDITTAINLLSNKQITLTNAARLSLELIESVGGNVDFHHLRYLIQLGAKALREETCTVSFEQAVKTTLEFKKFRSPRTTRDIKQTMKTLMNCEQGLAQRSLRQISASEWQLILNKAYHHSPSRFIKARANLSGVYTIAFKQGWCSENPIKRVHIPLLKERPIEALQLHEIKALFAAARHPEHRPCLPALALMLYAGVRPDEIKRLCWQDIDWEDSMLYMSPRHTKTGGGRHIPLIPPLLKFLKKSRGQGQICPKGWTKRWQYLRQVAGFEQWVPDILRHSYASYHAKMHQNLPQLQLSMGHRDSQLLLTRYINLRGITKKDATQFWKAEWLSASYPS